MEKLMNPVDFIEHLTYILQENEHIHLSTKSLYDIEQTIKGAVISATSGQKEVIQQMRQQYFDLKKQANN
ncbi:hypothetical protein [Priestia koreensis]|uniref:hypothetical protein n=1 Tax=Priestia koreensis TaxID=284581 RepID=UPI00203CC86C|nr:hypothetical protein [Priestia koreensis]MCM3004377.1 hypothetical protein [Priestia koreensis]